MSPLAQMIVKADLAAGAAHSVMPELQTSDCHCFETSEVTGIIKELALNPQWKGAEDNHIFLPSPITWIEWRTKNNGRKGFLLYEGDANIGGLTTHGSMKKHIVAVMASFNSKTQELVYDDRPLYLGKTADGKMVGAQDDDQYQIPQKNLWGTMRWLGAALAIINTPKIIGRKQHLPHAGMQRKIAASRKMVGKFPLQAWSEIKLEVTPPKIDGMEHEVRLSGGKALHFCRAHLRIRRGQLERVTAHWRGDPALGIKQTRYVVVPPTNSSPLRKET